MEKKAVHEGRNVKRLRDILEIKQETLADALGVSQQSVSLLETKEKLDPEVLQVIAKTMNIPVETIKNFSEELAINIINNTFHDNAVALNYKCTVHPVEKIIQLHEEKIALYERMLKEKEEMMVRLERLLDKLK